MTRGWVIFRRRWPILLACLAIATVGVAVYNVSAGKNYVASTEVFLRAPDVKTSVTAYQGDLFSRQRAQTYVKTFQSDELAQMVIDKLGLKMTPRQLSSRVSASYVKNTVLMVVSVTDPDPQRAANIANEYGNLLGAYIAKLENVSNDPNYPPLIQVVAKANPASVKHSGFPTWMVAFAAGAMALFVAAALIWFLEHFDTKVISRRQVEEITGSEIIGKLPKISDVKALRKSEKLRQAALRLSLNVDSVLQRLPKAGSPPKVAVVAGNLDDRGTIATSALAQAFADRRRMVGVVRFAKRRQQPDATDPGTVRSAPKHDQTNPVTTVINVTAGLTPESVGRELEQLRPSNNVVLIDTPPFHESTDAQLALGAADAAILVVRPVATTTASLSELVAGVKVLGKPILGVVVNMAKETATVDGLYL
ncbi:Wzz/FepE/Etk N-terminal domain-containing protein [Mycobacterium sp. 663a-19]|uniref:Wzz/FepE/Etk N-terminal domain-containing protein n=1 Tax=Mycobacterium sp. 663a-19 TaxID=2986148 RepID=UPI002D77EB95|nr:Wzz/FepE/Etk N-terminal domain-containing protein [Mycobacterium sp. 663a-19]